MNFKQIQAFTFTATLIGISLVFFWMLRSYMFPIFWAAVIAVLAQPLYDRLLIVCKQKRGLAAAATMMVVVLIFLIPAAGLLSLIIQQAFVVYKDFGNAETVASISTTLNGFIQLPIINNVIGDINIQDAVSKWGSTISKYVYQFLASSGQDTARVLIQFFIMLYALYYFIRDGKAILKKLMHLLPLGDQHERELFKRFVSTTRATLKGTLLIGAIQGIIGTVAFLICGIPAALFWGIIMVVLSIIPGIGATIVMVPAIIILLLTGNVWQAVVVLIALVIASVIDNVLRGPLVGKDTQMHPLLIFFATLGGLLSFGITGIIIGPVITAFFLSIWEIYAQKYKAELNISD